MIFSGIAVLNVDMALLTVPKASVGDNRYQPGRAAGSWAAPTGSRENAGYGLGLRDRTDARPSGSSGGNRPRSTYRQIIRIVYCVIIKVFVQYRIPFWRDRGLS